MRSRWIAAGVSVLAMALPATAMAGTEGSSQGGGAGGAGQAQLSSQWATTLQGAVSQAEAVQNAVNTNAPVTTAGGSVYGGGSNATQNATNVAASAALNGSKTDQSNRQTQTADPSGSAGYGGAGQAQASSQWAATLQGAASRARGDQNAVNTNAPATTAGHDVIGGNSRATQNATNAGLSHAGNGSKTDQSNRQSQDPSSGPSQKPSGGDSQQSSGGDRKGPGHGSSGSGGTGQFQGSSQWAATLQAAQSEAKAKQNAVNTNSPVTVAGDNAAPGGSNATQNATNLAGSAALNGSKTDQHNSQTQTADPSCYIGCAGSGQAQFNSQGALTAQYAASRAKADQNAVNANVPVTIAGHNVYGGSSNATQNTTNAAGSLAGNLSSTDQSNSQSQKASSDCLIGCGGSGQAQFNNQQALTGQAALSSADANQNAVNANVPVTIAGKDAYGGSSNATQNATNLAGSAALNGSNTSQDNSQSQSAGSSCHLGCGGAGQAQFSSQGALTGQYAASQADANQNAVNANVPVTIAGKNAYGGNSNATQRAGNAGASSAGNLSGTGQNGGQSQTSS
jgi:hypothetical protein